MGIGSLQLGHSITVFIILNSLDSGQEGVDEVPHVSLVGFEVKRLTAGLANDFADVQVVLKLLLDAPDVGTAVAGRLQFVGDVGIGSH